MQCCIGSFPTYVVTLYDSSSSWELQKHNEYISRMLQGSKRIVNRPRRRKSWCVSMCVQQSGNTRHPCARLHCNHVDMQSAKSICQVVWNMILSCKDIRVVVRFDPKCACLGFVPNMVASL